MWRMIIMMKQLTFLKAIQLFWKSIQLIRKTDLTTSHLTLMQNSLQLLISIKKWSKAWCILHCWRVNKYWCFKFIGYTYNLMSEEELNKKYWSNYIFDLKVYIFMSKQIMLCIGWRNTNQQLINEAKENKIYQKVGKRILLKTWEASSKLLVWIYFT